MRICVPGSSLSTELEVMTVSEIWSNVRQDSPRRVALGLEVGQTLISAEYTPPVEMSRANHNIQPHRLILTCVTGAVLWLTKRLR